MFFTGAITLGFLGAFHCIGMCGPIAMSLPVYSKKGVSKVLSILSYNIGRITTYSFFGLLFGLIGESFSFFGFQQKLSIILGALILISLFVPINFKTEIHFFKPVTKLLVNLKTALTQQFRKKGISSLFVTGMLNGLLPCGLVYMAAAASVSSGNWTQSVLFMILFGIGTIPFMFTISYYSNLINIKFRSTVRKIVPVIVATMAILMILRGMNLGITYISPKLNTQHNEVECTKKSIKCCHK